MAVGALVKKLGWCVDQRDYGRHDFFRFIQLEFLPHVDQMALSANW